ncbi:conserved mitochondrial Ferritin_like domain-containing protein [Andalucia godoyi]|uniref:Conserved mitochondrial Ferritin_like domain-containing protein n=1 Tax=Andalucia godoyi TaxID=505711 RepID=A0A8K0AIR0_ANDGO|nr:conserved mitochondrial Ferritin_like domain-containing protein [Andalucia godoyi]|eukprot:ANDGO_00516.mRNA.1 conserved mitochondrial Ferritin_like domain-containing protein
MCAAASAIPRSLHHAALAVLRCPSVFEKSNMTQCFYELYQTGAIGPVRAADAAQLAVSDHPARPSDLNVVPPGNVAKRSIGESAERRASMIHSLAHIESWAIDLSWDIIARFAHIENLPEDFFQDWLKVAEDESRHFRLLSDRLQSLGSHYGSLPVHDGLWSSAMNTKHDILARLVVVHCVHEARGLDVTPQIITRFRNIGDHESAELLERIYNEEISHVSCGVKWFRHLCPQIRSGANVQSVFQELVRNYFHGKLQPPFNVVARTAAGLSYEWYEPLSR